MQHLHLTESRVSYLNNRSVDILDDYYETARALRPSAGFDTIKRQQGPYLWFCGTFNLKRDFVNAKRACSRLYEIGLSEYVSSPSNRHVELHNTHNTQVRRTRDCTCDVVPERTG